MVSSEATPFAKTGGLADVVGSLPAALKPQGWDAAVVLPRYGSIPLGGARRVFDTLPIWFGPNRWDASVYLAVVGGVPFYLVDCPPLYDRPGLYGEAGEEYPDNHIRFAVLCRAALAIYRYIFRAEIIHCHDWQAGLVPTYLNTVFALDPTFLGAKTLFTIHNLGYQGLFPAAALTDIGLDASMMQPEALEYWRKISLIKGGLEFSHALNTVSPTYAREIQTPEYGLGLDGVLRRRASVLTGILNGVDYTEWDPETDPVIPANYSVEDLSGKTACKQGLLAEFGLPPEAVAAPLIGIVSRFTRQKGADLIAAAGAELVAQGFYMVALGTGEPEYEDLFRGLAAAYPDRIAVRVAYDNALAHRIEAGADIFLMPSQYEPCGLNQIYSLRYGTVPVVRATGGLDDTIREDTGFKFQEYTAEAMLRALRAAGEAFLAPPRWTAMMRCGMQQDFSWRVSAAQYAALYGRLAGRSEPPAGRRHLKSIGVF
jgi:starch synthase